MKHTDVRSWLDSICTYRQSQVKTLSVLVYAAMATVRLTLAQLGRTIARQWGSRQSIASNASIASSAIIASSSVWP